MPFTFSHPAIVLPLAYLPRQWFSLTGLVIGSLTPDFEYFIRMRVQSNYSHTLNGLLWFDLPLGLLLAFLFHNVVKESLFGNLPAFLRKRLIVFKHFNWNSYFTKKWFVVIISILIGAASHLLWDSFTHDSGYFAQAFPALMSEIEIFDRRIHLYKILQHSSTIIGGIIIAFTLLKLPVEKHIEHKTSFKYWSILISMAFTIVTIRLLLGIDYKLYGHLIVTIISATIISLVLTPILTRIIGILPYKLR